MSMLEKLVARGFDESSPIEGTASYRVKCSSCDSLVINGTPCHETGCSNATHECRGCNTLLPARQRYCEDCS